MENPNRYYRDGKIAVLISPGYGAGWYSWNTEHRECIFDKDIVELVLKKMDILEELKKLSYKDRQEATKRTNSSLMKISKIKDNIVELAKQKFGDGFYTRGAEDLEVEFVSIGSNIQINEYDGSESLNFGYNDYINCD